MPQLTVNLMGAFQAALDGAVLSGFDSDKTRALLAYLAIEADRAHRRESLVALFWPNVQEASARQSLSQALSNLRRLLADVKSDTPFILATRDTVQFNRQSDYKLDVDTLQRAPERFRPLLEGVSIPGADGFDEWLLLQREALQNQALEALDDKAGQALATGDHARAIALARRQLEIDPWREEAHCQLMRAFMLNGQRNDALAQFERCKKLLLDELGVPPSSETVALFEQIKAGNWEFKNSRALPQSANARMSSQSLPVALTPFVGRERELTALQNLIGNSTARLITLVGVGGMGKTRLAVEAARQAQQAFENGCVFVPLAAVTAASQILPAIAQAMGVALSPQVDSKHQIFSELAQANMLIIVDNFEQLLDDEHTVELVTDLLRAAPRVTFMATTREPLSAPGEWVFDLDGLGAAAHTLFVQTARRAQAHWHPDEADARHIERICQLVGGMPLGIELAASWLRTLSCAEIASEIETNIAFLATTTRQVNERHRSITAVFDASWRLLSDDERKAMESLSVFNGGFTREAAKEVASATLLTLSSLVAKALVRRVKVNRYDLHELVGQYATQRLNESGRSETARDTHQRFFAALAMRSTEAWMKGNRSVYVDVILPDLDNARAAVAWAFGESSNASRRAAAILVIANLPFVWRAAGQLSVARKQLRTLLDAEDDLPLDLRGAAVHTAGHMALWQTDAAQAQAYFEETLRLLPDATGELPGHAISISLDWISAMTMLGLGELASQQNNYSLALTRYEDGYKRFAQIGDSWGISEALIGIARHSLGANNLPQQRQQLEESVRLKREIGDLQGLGWALSWLSTITHQLGDFETTERHLVESLSLQDQVGDKFGKAINLNRMAELRRQKKDYAGAISLYEQSTQLLEEAGIQGHLAAAQNNLGHMHLEQNDVPHAAKLFKQSLATFMRLENKEGVALALAGLGRVALATQRPHFATVCLAAADQLMDDISYYFESTDRVDFERSRDAARTVLGLTEFETAWVEGRSTDRDRILQQALAL